MTLAKIKENPKKYLEDFFPEEIDNKYLKIYFCDEELIIKKLDIYAIYGLNYFFDMFNCQDAEEIDIKDFLKAFKIDLKNEYNFLEQLMETDFTKEELKEVVKEYIDALVYNKNKSLNELILDYGLI